MQKSKTLSLPPSTCAPNNSLSFSPTARSCGTFEDFTYNIDGSTSHSPSRNDLSILTKKNLEDKPTHIPPSINKSANKEPMNLRSRSDTSFSKRSRYSTLSSDFVEEYVPALAFHDNESGEFDFAYQTD